MGMSVSHFSEMLKDKIFNLLIGIFVAMWWRQNFIGWTHLTDCRGFSGYCVTFDTSTIRNCFCFVSENSSDVSPFLITSQSVFYYHLNYLEAFLSFQAKTAFSRCFWHVSVNDKKMFSEASSPVNATKEMSEIKASYGLTEIIVWTEASTETICTSCRWCAAIKNIRIHYANRIKDFATFSASNGGMVSVNYESWRDIVVIGSLTNGDVAAWSICIWLQ